MHWAVLLSIPLTAAALGYLTRVLAVVLMFRPREFVGVRPLGWCGAVPRHAGRLAAVNADLLTGRLLDPRELFAGVDADRLRAEVEQPLLRAVDTIARDVLAEHHPGVWESLPPFAQELAVKRLQAAVPRIARELVDGLRENVETVVDLRRIATRRLADPDRMVRLVRAVSGPDLRFTTWAALGIGLAAGIVEAAMLALTGWPALLPLCGAAIGAGAGWLAVELVLCPREPRSLLGRVTVRGSVHRRRAAVARAYGELIAEEVLTPEVLLDALAHGTGSWRAREVLARIVDELVEEQVRAFRPLVAATIGVDRVPAMKRTAAARALAAIPDTVRRAHRYLADAMAVGAMVDERVRGLPPAEFELLMRPPVRASRPALLAFAAVAGAAVGFLQLLLPLG